MKKDFSMISGCLRLEALYFEDFKNQHQYDLFSEKRTILGKLQEEGFISIQDSHPSPKPKFQNTFSDSFLQNFCFASGVLKRRISAASVLEKARPRDHAFFIFKRGQIPLFAEKRMIII